MIKEIQMNNIKGQTGVQKLTGRDIITGRNGAGKTTRMQALTLAMLGYVPGIDRKNSAIFELSSDPGQMSVGLQTDELEFVRKFLRKEKLNNDGSIDTSFSQSISLAPSEGEKTNTQKEKQIKSVMGDFPVMLDFNAFISMSEMQQRDFIYSLSGQTDLWDREYIINRIKDYLLTDTLKENNPEMYEIMEENVEDVISCYGKKLDMSKGILAMVEQAKAKKNYWTQRKSEADGAARKLAEMKNRAGETDRDLNSNIQEKKQLEAERDALISKIATYEAQNARYKQYQIEISQLQDKLNAITNIDIESMVNDLKSKIRENPYIGEYYDLVEKRDRWINEAGQYNYLDTELAEVEAEIRSIKKLIKAMSDNAGYCALNPAVPCNQSFASYIDSSTDELMVLEQKKAELLKENEKRLTLREFIYAAEDKIDKALCYKNEIEEDNADIQAEINRLEAMNPTEQISFIKEQIESKESLMEAEPYADLEPYQLQKQELTDKIMAIEEKIKEQQQIRTTLSSIKENMIDSTEAGYQMLTWKQIAEVLGQKGIQGEIVKQMLDPISDAVSEKLRGLQDDNGNAPREFFFRTENENGKESFSFGWISDKGEIPFSALSQGEQMLLLTALMVVIIERNNPPIKVLAMDNVNHLDQSNVQRIVTGLQHIGTSMDNIILAGVINTDKLNADGWSITEI